MRNHIYPHVQSVWNDVSTEEVIIDKYLSIIDDNRKYKLLAMPFLVKSESFLKKHKERCIIFYNTPDPADGLMLTIHQISPSLHIHSRLFCWTESDEVHDYMTCLLFHKNSDEAVQFMNSNFELAREGNTEDKSHLTGFRMKN